MTIRDCIFKDVEFIKLRSPDLALDNHYAENFIDNFTANNIRIFSQGGYFIQIQTPIPFVLKNISFNNFSSEPLTQIIDIIIQSQYNHEHFLFNTFDRWLEGKLVSLGDISLIDVHSQELSTNSLLTVENVRGTQLRYVQFMQMMDVQYIRINNFFCGETDMIGCLKASSLKANFFQEFSLQNSTFQNLKISSCLIQIYGGLALNFTDIKIINIVYIMKTDSLAVSSIYISQLIENSGSILHMTNVRFQETFIYTPQILPYRIDRSPNVWA